MYFVILLPTTTYSIFVTKVILVDGQNCKIKLSNKVVIFFSFKIIQNTQMKMFSYQTLPLGPLLVQCTYSTSTLESVEDCVSSQGC